MSKIWVSIWATGSRTRRHLNTSGLSLFVQHEISAESHGIKCKQLKTKRGIKRKSGSGKTSSSTTRLSEPSVVVCQVCFLKVVCKDVWAERETNTFIFIMHWWHCSYFIIKSTGALFVVSWFLGKCNGTV